MTCTGSFWCTSAGCRHSTHSVHTQFYFFCYLFFFNLFSLFSMLCVCVYVCVCVQAREHYFSMFESSKVIRVFLLFAIEKHFVVKFNGDFCIFFSLTPVVRPSLFQLYIISYTHTHTYTAHNLYELFKKKKKENLLNREQEWKRREKERRKTEAAHRWKERRHTHTIKAI